MNSTLGSVVPLAMFISCHFYIPRGWIANELFRRVHPDGKTIGGFIRENISKPLGERVQRMDFIIFFVSLPHCQGARVFVGVQDAEIEDYEPGREVGTS